MATWTQEELTRIGDAEELDIAARRPDGSLRPFVTIWVVRGGDDLYYGQSRAVKGPGIRAPSRPAREGSAQAASTAT